MTQAIITSGFQANSNSVKVAASVANGTVILLFDDETKDQIGSGVIASGSATVTVSPVLYLGQRIIAYVGEFGNGTFGAVIVTQSDTENTGWKTPETVDGVDYQDYIEAGGKPLPDIYDPEECRNISRDKDAIDRIVELPITFRIKQVESQAGTVQILIEDIRNAVGGYLVKFDGDPAGATTSKIYNTNGSYSVKVWGSNQTIADAITETYVLVMPTVTVEFGTNVIDLWVSVDLGYTGSPGQRVITLVANSFVACQFQIDGLLPWVDGVWQIGGLAFRSELHLIPAGEYTIRARNKAVPSEEISRQIKLAGF